MSDSSNIQITWPMPGNTITKGDGMVYTIGKQIGSGGFALVFEGIDLFGNDVALKVLKPANRPFDEVKKQWENECELFKRLRHPNVVAIYDNFICENLFYIVLEKAWGNLEDFKKTVGLLNEPALISLTRQLLFAIYYIHSNQIVHRDITIYNTYAFIGPDSVGPIFKISDFGISKEFYGAWQDLKVLTKTAHPGFLPPELLLPSYGFTTVQTDLYHLGLILLYLRTGFLPFDGAKDQDEINKRIVEGLPRKKAEEIRTPLGDFISVLLRRRQEYRFQCAIDAWKELQQIVPK